MNIWPRNQQVWPDKGDHPAPPKGIAQLQTLANKTSTALMQAASSATTPLMRVVFQEPSAKIILKEKWNTLVSDIPKLQRISSSLNRGSTISDLSGALSDLRGVVEILIIGNSQAMNRLLESGSADAKQVQKALNAIEKCGRDLLKDSTMIQVNQKL